MPKEEDKDSKYSVLIDRKNFLKEAPKAKKKNFWIKNKNKKKRELLENLENQIKSFKDNRKNEKFEFIRKAKNITDCMIIS